MLNEIRDRIESARHDARGLPYDVVLQNMPEELRDEFIQLTRIMEGLPNKYPGEGDLGIDGPLTPEDQAIWDRYGELYRVGSELAKSTGYQTIDPATTTLSGRFALSLLRIVGNEPRNLHL